MIIALNIALVVLSLVVAAAMVTAIDVSRQKRLQKARREPVRHEGPKMPMVKQEGVCQCGDAFCFHGPDCKVQGCVCQIFTPSTLTEEQYNVLNSALLQQTAKALESKKKPKDEYY